MKSIFSNTPKSRTKSLSNTKVRGIEKGFVKNVESSRDEYLKEELEKYKKIKVFYDVAE